MMGAMRDRPWGRGDWGLYVAVAAVSLGIALVTLQVWDANWLVPWSDLGDAIPVASHFKTVFETGWYESQPLLGAPFGQQYHDFPTAETTNFVMATVLGHLLGSWALAMNVYFVLGFPLAALAAAWFIRVAGGSRLLTLPTATLFAILPFHFTHGEPHLFISSYYVIPLGLVLALRAARGESLWGWRRGSTHPVGRWFGRGLQTVVLVVLIGSTDTYFAIFVLIMVATGGLIGIFRDRAWPRFGGAALAGILVVVVMLANMADDYFYSVEHGPNPGAFQRMPEHTEYFSFKLAQLLLPWSGHQITGLAAFRQQYDAGYPLVSEQPALGFIPAVGFLILLGVLIHRAITTRRSPVLGERRRTFGLLAVLSLIAFLFGVVGGLGTFVSLFSDVLRSWNRILVVIALLGLTAVALSIDAGFERWVRTAEPTRGIQAALGAVTIAALLVLGFVDQTPGSNDHVPTNARFLAYDAYFGRIQASLEPGDWVVQLPYQEFPEAHTATGSDANDVLIPYLHTTGIGWTGGGLRGRPESDWTEVLQGMPSEEIPAVAAAAGASGILIDRVASTDAQLGDWVPAFTAALGDPLTSDLGRYLYWSLDAVPPAEVAAVGPDVLSGLLQGREWSP
jgi:phosphoglycerol transferase